MLAYECFKPIDFQKLDVHSSAKIILRNKNLGIEDNRVMLKTMANLGLGEESYGSETIMAKISILIINVALFASSPSLTSRYKMREDIKYSFELAGMGCSASIISVEVVGTNWVDLNIKSGINHFCIHPGSRGIIDGIGYMEAKTRIKKDDKILMIGAATALMMGTNDLHEFGRSHLERNDFSMNGTAGIVNPASSSRYETFVYLETVKLILAKGNPHFACDGRVLVKPYKKKGKVQGKYKQILKAFDLFFSFMLSVK
ncbi:hypothetical protein FEM48_Zijuj03G0079000 [Ziziphus jujuba var. spinosa]|uniref:FAE domain-containing protein n=1 Tax=Ziziphus jujuba var. spinosa TaxID=714518 RepID=A0A978VP34_ZIZJJ|nr:hypothetical protein FEM48_Zijuj03G0079000 [Ziziphus jujuba var. spinosa]